MSKRVALFGEDVAHEAILANLIHRLAGEAGVSIRLQVLSVRGGHARMLRELEDYLGEVRRGQQPCPDLFVLGRDANCQGFGRCRQELEHACGEYWTSCIPAIPDPHVERWLLLDSAAFRAVFGRGCQAPDAKCDKDRYKQLLEAQIRAADVEPLLGGVEFADELVLAMDLKAMSKTDDLGRFLQALQGRIASWQS